eukprot:1295735-Amphidinium_carterae.1
MLRRLALQSTRSYAVKRAVAFEGLTTEAKVTPGSILPGCAMATHFMKLVLKPLLMRVSHGLDLATLGNVVDDVSLQTFGPQEDVIQQATCGHQQQVQGLTDLHLKVNEKKTHVVGSSQEVLSCAYREIAGGKSASHTKFLGALRSTGRRRRTALHTQE